MAVVASWGWVWGPNPSGNTTNLEPAVWKQRQFLFMGRFFVDSQMTQRKVHEMLVGSKRDLDFIEFFHGFIKHPYIVWLGSLSSSQKHHWKCRTSPSTNPKAITWCVLCHPNHAATANQIQFFFADIEGLELLPKSISRFETMCETWSQRHFFCEKNRWICCFRFGKRNLMWIIIMWKPMMRRKPWTYSSHKKATYFPLYWLSNRDPYNGLL